MKRYLVLIVLIVVLAWANDDLSLPGAHSLFDENQDGSASVKCIITPSEVFKSDVKKPPPFEVGISSYNQKLITVSVFDPAARDIKSDVCKIETRHRRPFASLLWVDRNHRYAVAENVAISGDGMNIIAGWWLNNERISNYRTMGTSTPLWEYSVNNVAQWMISVGASRRAEAIAATEGSMPAYDWQSVSPMPRWIYNYPSGLPYGRGEAVSKNGQIVAVAGSGLLYVFNAQTGETLYTRPFNPTRGLTGLGGGGQNCVDISSDGSVILISTYDSTYIWRNGQRAANLSGYGQTPSRISEDGRIVVLGTFNGRVNTYRWNGTDYEPMWSASIGGPWVTAVDVSGDGSTIMAGTGYNNGTVYMFDSSSSTPLWNYANFGSYGALTSCVDLNYNGRYGVISSWGDTATTGTFDVLAIFQKTSSTPIFEVIRDQELGSLFYCDISDSGDCVTAGGKAVHAYVGGNGGEVYSIQVFNTLNHDVGVTKIISPPELLQVGNSYSPQAEVKNFGSSIETFPVLFEIYDSLGGRLYSATTNVTSLPPNSTARPTFSPSWTVSQQGWYLARAATQLAGDQFPTNDTVGLLMRCYHDVGISKITAPFAEITINYGMIPTAVAINLGSYIENFPVICQIRDTTSGIVYADTVQVTGLAPYAQVAVNFNRTWLPNQIGLYTVSVFSNLVGDYHPANDRCSSTTMCTYEIIYDDRGFEAFYWVGRRNNDKFYVRFTPTINPPFSIKRGRIMVNMANTPFDYVLLVPDSSGMPDTANPLQRVDNVSSPVAPGWAQFALDVNRYDRNDMWIVIHWPDNSPAMGVGADANQPRDYRSYYSSNQDPFTQWNNHDWMVRILQDPNVAIEERNLTCLPVLFDQPVPNPFRRATSLKFTTPVNSEINITIYNVAGQCVRNLLNGKTDVGTKTITWNGRDSNGKNLASGVYFLKFEINNLNYVHKIVLQR